MNWYIGQEIVCVDDNGAETVRGTHSGLKEGNVYTITSLSKPCCLILITVGIKTRGQHGLCSKCGKEYNNDSNEWKFSEFRFRPLDELADISELTEVLSEPVFNVKL